MRRAIWAGLAAVVLGLSPLTLAPGAGAATPPDFVEGQILVKFRDDQARAGVLRQHGLGDGPGIGSTGARLIRVPAGKELRLIEALGRNPGVEYAEPDAVATALADPPVNDPYFKDQYALQNVGQSFTNNSTDPNSTITIPAGTPDADVDAVEAWAVTTGGGIRVAVIDSGVDLDHEDISSQVVERVNFTADGADDEYGHGTHVAGIVAATSNNGVGVAGVCPGCTILDVKVLDRNGYGSASGIARGIDWAAGNGAKVINLSLGMRLSTRTLETAVNNAWNRGAVLVAAAGNAGTQAKIYPGAYPNVIAVAATDNMNVLASFSSYGARWVDVAAPGVSVYSTFPNHPSNLATANNRALSYDIGSGTSMASPIVAATAALAWNAHPGSSNASVRARVESSADETVKGTGTLWAHGLVNANAAVH